MGSAGQQQQSGIPARGILSQRRSTPTSQPSSSRTPRTHNETPPGTGRASRLPSASNYVPSPSGTTVAGQNIPESIEKAGRVMEALYSRDLQYPSLFAALVGREQTGTNT